jgi:hypothetical protein
MISLRKALTILALTLAAGFSALVSDAPVEASTFAVSSSVALIDSPESATTVPDPYAPGASPDIQTTLNIPSPHSNFSQVFTFGPPGTQVTQGSSLPIGAVVGNLTSDTRLGLVNSPCNQIIAVPFIFLNGTTNNAVSNLIYPLVPSDPNPLLPLAEDDGDFPTTDPTLDSDSDGIPDGLDTNGPATAKNNDGTIDRPAYAGNGIPDGIDAFPSYLATMFDPDETSPPSSGIQPLQPWARYAGVTKVASLDVALQLLVFKPGDLTNFDALPNHPFAQFVSSFGWPTTVVLNDPTVAPAPSSITDFCTPLSTTTTLFGTTVDNECTPRATPPKGNCPNAPTTLPSATTPNEGGVIRATNPANNKGILGTNTHLYATYATSLRDADSDGKENQLDTCPTTSDNLNPRLADATNDTDGDGIANACDAVSTPGGTDQDGDGWQNRQDNCPQFSNDPNVDSELDSPLPADGGPRADGIGDECDPNPTVGDGHYHVVFTLAPVCIKASPNGGAFYCPETMTALSASSGTPEHRALHQPFQMHDGAGKATAIAPATGAPGQPCNDGVDNDNGGGSDGADSGCGTTDTDGDGFSDSTELNIGTDPRYPCALSGHAPGDAGFAGTHDARPTELFPSSARVTDFQDMNAMVPFLFQPVSFPTSNRFDLFPSAAVDFQDMNALTPHLFTSCSAP